MSKDKVKNLIKLIFVCAVAVVVTVLAVVFVLQDNAYAWFAKNTLVSANGIEVGIQVDESVVGSVDYYKISSISGSSYTFTAPESDDSGNAQMDTYDSSEDNAYQIVVKITPTSGTDSVTVVAQVLDYTFQTESGTATKKYLGADDADYLVESGNPMSSVVAFEIYYSDTDSSSISETGSDGETTAITLTPDSREEYSFITEDKKLSSSVSLGTHEFTGTGSNSVYIVIKYNSIAISEVFSHNIGNEVCSDAKVAFDLCDFSFSVS
ncbi:MAG: hypothetical protein ACI4VK_00465 [Candidatus Coproplasma sp.]